MRTKVFAIVLPALCLLTACGGGKTETPKVTPVVAPEFKMPDLPDLNDVFKICQKTEAELDLTEQHGQTAVQIKDIIETKEIIELGCNGERKSLGRQPVRSLKGDLLMDAPEKLSEDVNYVVIQNSRASCIDFSIQSMSGEVFNSLADAQGMTLVTIDGRLMLSVTDSNLKFQSLKVNVGEGLNPITIQYFGKCLKKKDQIVEKAGDFVNCAEPKLLAEKKVMLKVEIERPEKGESEERETCKKR